MDTDNPAIDLARRIIETTHTHLFLTGKAGTGKTTFLRRLRSDSPKRMVVLAPTGIAAINAGGITIHSFFQLPFSPFVPGAGYENSKAFSMRGAKLKIIQSIDLLVIDEISMVRADLLDAVDAALRRFRRNSQPFGGVQLLLIGDLQQLAPVARDEEWRMLSAYYETPYFFSSHALKKTPYVTVELEKVYRQQDSGFLDLLNSIREGHPSQAVLNALNSRYVPDYRPTKEEGCIRLMTHNSQANRINAEELERLKGKAYTYQAVVTGKFPEYSYPTEAALTLKQGAQVMFVKNDAEKRYFNGMIGEVVSIGERGFSVRTNESPRQVIEVTPEVWTNARYDLDKESMEITEVVDGTFEQYPVRLAWAITIHKSQGLTFDRVYIDASAAFAHGQTYVALSRCRTLEGIVLGAPIPPSAVIADRYIDQFTAQIRRDKVDEAAIRQQQSAYTQHLLAELFSFDKERIAFAAVVRVFDESLATVYPNTVKSLGAALRSFDLDVMGVAGRFHAQYTVLAQQDSCMQDSDQPSRLQERIAKGAAYFVQKLQEAWRQARQGRVEVDNAAVRKRLEAAFDEMERAVQLHISLLQTMGEQGFSTSLYLNTKAKLLLRQEQESEGGGKDRMRRAAKSAQKSAKAKQPAKLAIPLEVKNPVLYYRLQQWRSQLAQERDVPAYTILHNKVLMALCNYVPTSAEEMLRIPSFGQRALQQYGADLLKLMDDYRTEAAQGKVRPLEVVSTENMEVVQRRTDETTFEASLRLFREGNSPAEIAAKRGYSESTIFSHLARFVESGELSVSDLVSEAHQERIRQWLLNHQDAAGMSLTDIRREVGEDIPYGEIRLVLNRSQK